MKLLTVLPFLVVPALALSVVSCKKEAQADATQPLQQSFEKAEPEARQAIQTVNSGLKAGNYAEATRALSSMVTDRPMTDAQKQAVGVALQQVNQAIAANPALDTKEMYNMRAKIFQAVQSGPRF